MAKALHPVFSAGRIFPRGIRTKLLWAFVLMSVVPLVMLFCVAAWFAFPSVREFYQLERWFPMIANPAGATWWVIGLLALTVVIALLGGVYLTIKLIDPIVRLTHEAKHLARGDVSRELPMPTSWGT
jgi:nitrogen fixation/metabolism regulation signal transduction histidine kinase